MWITRFRPVSILASSAGAATEQQPLRVRAMHTGLLRPKLHRLPCPRHGARRHLSLETPAEMLIAYPFISYGTTIVLLTLTLRTCTTLPMAIWSRARMKRIKDIVQPEMQRLNDKLAVQLVQECRKNGLGYEEYRKELKKQLATHQSALHKLHKTHPLPTLAAPLLLHLPLFLFLSYTIRTAAASPQFLAETYPTLLPWIESMGQVDPKGILPIGLGIMAFGNAEWADRRRLKVEDELDVKAEVKAEKVKALQPTPKLTRAQVEAKRQPVTATITPVRRPAAGAAARPQRLPTSPKAESFVRQPKLVRPPLMPATPVDGENVQRQRSLRGVVVTNLMRVLAVAFVPVALQVPAALSLYWITSVSYSFVQNVGLDWYDKRKEEASKKKDQPVEASA